MSTVTSDLSSVCVLSFRNRSLDLMQFFRRLNFGGRLKPILQEALMEEMLAEHASENGMVVTDDDLQKAADLFRRREGLATSEQTMEWLNRNGLSVVDFEALLESPLLKQLALADITKGAKEFFHADSSAWDRLMLQIIEVPQQALAEELLAKMLEEGADFSELAASYSQHPSAELGGRMNPAFRSSLPLALRERLVDSENGTVIGPFSTDRGWVLVLPEAVQPAVFDSETAEAVGQRLFKQWLDEKLRSTAASFPLLDLISCSETR
jgi:parvulin-like peptidyl-prolyl isomerase